MKRDADDMSKVILSWDEVADSTGYILKMYARNDTDKETLLYSFDTSKYHAEQGTTMTPTNGKISYSLAEIFGSNYEKLVEFGQITAFDLMTDYDVVFDLITIGNSDRNNSLVFSFNASLKGNPIAMTDISVDSFGSIVFVSEIGQSYIYRFVTADGTELQAWKTVNATAGTTKLELDTKKVDTATLFNVEIIVVGSAIEQPATTADYNFELDSLPITTVGKDLTFVVNDEVALVGYHELLPSSLAFTLVPNSFTCLYVGLTEDAISKEEIVSFVPLESHATEVEFHYVYSYSFAQLIDELRDAGYEINTQASDLSLYFWVYRETTNVSGSYTISKVYEFKFNFTNETTFSEIMKVGDLGEDAKFTEDYTSTFATFVNNDTVGSFETLGIYVKITQLTSGPMVEEETDSGDIDEELPDEGVEQLSVNATEYYSTTKFLTKAQMINHSYFEGQDLFVINLTALFEQEDLLSLTGTFKVEFARLQIETVTAGETITQKFVLCDWISSDGDNSFEFERLPVISSLMLSAGSLYWSAEGEKVSRYYIYFIQGAEGEIINENYTYFATDKTYFNASEYVSTESNYYIAVQSVNEDPYLLSSVRVYITEVVDGKSKRAKVYKNQISSPLTLKDGQLHIDWDSNGDFYKILTSEEVPFADIAEQIAKNVFVSPFSFTLQQLLDNNITLRIRFTSINAATEGIRKTIDVNAKYLLTDLYQFALDNNFDMETRLKDLYTAAATTATKDLLDKFREAIVENGSHGIANSSVLFDDYFEAVQLGDYKMEYCLIGNNKTLSSGWYNFTNKNGDSILYVNEEPAIKAVKKSDKEDQAMNTYQLVIKKSKIYDYVDGNYAQVEAENYVMKITNDANAST